MSEAGQGIRRVVTGLDAQGRSTVLFDDRVPLGGTSLIWSSDTIPVDNSARADTAGPFTYEVFSSPGSTFLVTEMQPGATAAGPLMHATDTLDHLVVLKGRVRLHLERGSVDVGPGDCIVDRGVVHGWQVIGEEPLVMTNVLVPAAPVGAGSTI
jgi:mannose-6-phosphate isomerase-like protein (cupin superfamily)